MIDETAVYQACHQLFTGYPLAIADADCDGTVQSMVLMLTDGHESHFYVLTQGLDDGWPIYSIGPWPAGSVVDIRLDDSSLPEDMVRAITSGVPIPCDGSLFGWTCQSAVSAMIVVYTEYTPVTPQPSWGVMPLVGIPEAQWPPFTAQRLFGHWFWDYYRAGSVISLDELVAGTRETFFWLNTEAALGSDCCAVAHDVSSSAGHTVPRGRFVYYQVLHAGQAVPPLEALLADPDRTDLAPQFRSARSADWSRN